MTDKELYQQMLHFIECSGYRAEAIKKELKARLAQPDCVCGEPNSEGIHRKDKPCYVEPEPTVDGWPLYSGLPQPEPVAWGVDEGEGKCIDLHDVYFIPADAEYMAELKGIHAKVVPLYAAPPKKEWVGLTDEEISKIYDACDDWEHYEYERAIEAKLKEKNT